mmetsp:Transcript_10619/g.22998  ORF Transcript_10619/g.22998 Transcript_10619/m.22998 type:complete len:115 (+) Transcript_10619:342-686(+)
MMGFVNRWWLLGFVLSCQALYFFWSFSSFLFIFAAVAFRQQVRKRFQIRHGGLTWVTDCCTYVFCSCCAVAQEANMVDWAAASRHPAVTRAQEPSRSSDIEVGDFSGSQTPEEG